MSSLVSYIVEKFFKKKPVLPLEDHFDAISLSIPLGWNKKGNNMYMFQIQKGHFDTLTVWDSWKESEMRRILLKRDHRIIGASYCLNMNLFATLENHNQVKIFNLTNDLNLISNTKFDFKISSIKFTPNLEEVAMLAVDADKTRLCIYNFKVNRMTYLKEFDHVIESDHLIPDSKGFFIIHEMDLTYISYEGNVVFTNEAAFEKSVKNVCFDETKQTLFFTYKENDNSIYKYDIQKAVVTPIIKLKKPITNLIHHPKHEILAIYFDSQMKPMLFDYLSSFTQEEKMSA